MKWNYIKQGKANFEGFEYLVLKKGREDGQLQI